MHIMSTPAKVRVIFDCTEAMRRAIRIRAAMEGRTISDVIADALSEHLAEEMAQAERLVAAEEQKPRGRKPKSD